MDEKERMSHLTSNGGKKTMKYSGKCLLEASPACPPALLPSSLPPTHLPVCPLAYPPAHLPACPPACLQPTCPPALQPASGPPSRLPSYLSTCPSALLPILLPTCLPAHLLPETTVPPETVPDLEHRTSLPKSTEFQSLPCSCLFPTVYHEIVYSFPLQGRGWKTNIL